MNCRLASLTLVGLVLLSAGLGAQESASSGISGQVVDSTRGAMPGATVTVTNAGTNAQRVVVTDAEGRFTVPNLPPATYSIRVELSGFQTAEIRDLTLRNGEIARPDGDARPGEHLRERHRRRHVAAAADDQRVGRADDLAEAD